MVHLIKARFSVTREVVVAQLVGRLLPIPEVRGSNPVIVKTLFIYWTFVYCQLCIEKTKIKKKRPGMAHFFKKKFSVTSSTESGQHNLWQGNDTIRPSSSFVKQNLLMKQKTTSSIFPPKSNSRCLYLTFCFQTFDESLFAFGPFHLSCS